MGQTNMQSEESIRMEAADVLRQLKSFDEWVAGLDQDDIAAVEKTYGTLAVFYAQFFSELKSLAGECAEEQDISC